MHSEPVAAVEPIPEPESGNSPPASRSRALVLTFLALVAGIAATAWFEQLRYERFPGFLQARLRSVAATRDAEIAEILVAPGAVVTTGQPLVRLKDSAFDQRLEGKKREIEALEIELAQNQARLEVELEWRRKNVLELIFEARLKRAQAMKNLLQPPARLDLGRLSAWEAERIIPAVGGSMRFFEDRPLLEKSDANPVASSYSPEPAPESEVDLCTQHIEELERINRDLPEKISRSMGVGLAQTRLAHARSELAHLESQKTELTLVAEASGLVGVFQKDVGDHVAAHEPIVQLLDEEQPYLLLQVPSPRISDFAPGTVVELRFPGGRQGKGRVEEIPPQTSPIPGDNAPIGETVITAHVDPVGALWPSLPFGSTVEVRRKR